MIRELLEATPEPPDGSDIDALLYTFDVMRAARQEILDAMAAGPIVISDEDRALAEVLAARDAAWLETLGRAKATVGTQRVGTKQLRRYAPADARDL